MRDVRDLMVWRQSSPLRCISCDKLVFRNGQWAIMNDPGNYLDAVLVCGACWGAASLRGAVKYLDVV